MVGLPSSRSALRECSSIVVKHFADAKVCHFDAPIIIDEEVM